MARRRKGLSPDDRDLWERVKRSASPLSSQIAPQKLPSAPPLSVKSATPLSEPASPNQVKPFRIGERSHGPSPAHPQADLSDRLAHAPIRMRQSEHRRMQRGKLKPEARLDLHGMTLADAHPALIGFVSDAYDRGLRLLLVITGKGRGGSEPDHGPIPMRRGVLRQQVPGWLTAPPIGALVLEVREAHQRHGGGGAYYVYLKRRR
jgi:DNA-nicking Smr family endonuclease